MAKKKKWIEPKLIILMRGKPEESVLTICACGAKANDAAQVQWQCYQSCSSCWGGCTS
ncbi:MAG TPA: hypothetical protein PL125_03215 [Candidatus Omnitrophota bacterium]|nr:hypothetical protein [Candidatus Omnitrophota bacterium]HPT39189.1 hypothetical protein [Candidatus Omnitrophota bacterium]